MVDEDFKPAPKRQSRTIKVWTANVNGDDMPHIPTTFDILGLQELHANQLAELRKRYPNRHLYTPNDKNYHLGIMVNKAVFTPTGQKAFMAHPSGAAMQKLAKWKWGSRVIPKSLHTPKRGVFEVYGYWFGDKNRPGTLRVGHRINRGPSQAWRDHLGTLFDRLVYKRNKVTEKTATIEMYDYNQRLPRPSAGMVWVANHEQDHIGATRTEFKKVTGQKLGPEAGHKGRVHHHSLGITLRLR